MQNTNRNSNDYYIMKRNKTVISYADPYCCAGMENGYVIHNQTNMNRKDIIKQKRTEMTMIILCTDPLLFCWRAASVQTKYR